MVQSRGQFGKENIDILAGNSNSNRPYDIYRVLPHGRRRGGPRHPQGPSTVIEKEEDFSAGNSNTTSRPNNFTDNNNDGQSRL